MTRKRITREHLQRAFAGAWAATQDRQFVFGRLGRVEEDGSISVEVPTQPNYVYVMVDGEQASDMAFNTRGVNVEDSAGMPVRMKRIRGQLEVDEVNPQQASAFRHGEPVSAYDHGRLSGLEDDDHPDYACLPGRSGGQTLHGGTDAGDHLILDSTANPTKGSIIFGSAAIPFPNDTQDLGNSSLRWRDVWASRNIYAFNRVLGSNASGGHLRLESTAHATKGSVRVLDDLAVGGDFAPAAKLHVTSSTFLDHLRMVRDSLVVDITPTTADDGGISFTLEESGAFGDESRLNWLMQGGVPRLYPHGTPGDLGRPAQRWRDVWANRDVYAFGRVLGSNASGGELELESTSHATKGLVRVLSWLRVNERMGVGADVPSNRVARFFNSSHSMLQIDTSSSSSVAAIELYNGARQWSFRANTNAWFTIRDATAGVNVMNIEPGAPASSLHIDDDGFAGFGTDTPTQRLHVVGNILANRLPTMMMRRGGSATNWHTAGTTNYTPGQVRIQCGSVNTGLSGDVTVTFPVAFSNVPIVFVSSVGQAEAFAFSGIPTSSSVVVGLTDVDDNPFNGQVYWLAIGPM